MSGTWLGVPVSLHPESTEDPMTLRWVADTTALDEPTASMTALVDDGVLAELEIGSGQIRTVLAPGRSWADDGPQVRSVLFQALSGAQDTRFEGADGLYRQVAEVLRRDVAPFVDSHGGVIEIDSLTDDGVLTISLGGTCRGCTLRTSTLRNVVANAVQTRLPQIRTVRAVRG